MAQGILYLLLSSHHCHFGLWQLHLHVCATFESPCFLQQGSGPAQHSDNSSDEPLYLQPEDPADERCPQGAFEEKIHNIQETVMLLKNYFVSDRERAGEGRHVIMMLC